MKVRAVDSDTGPNGNVTYSLVKSNDQTTELFQVDRHTGVVRTADVFDREAQIGVTDYRVTVKAEVKVGVQGRVKVTASNWVSPTPSMTNRSRSRPRKDERCPRQVRPDVDQGHLKVV